MQNHTNVKSEHAFCIRASARFPTPWKPTWEQMLIFYYSLIRGSVESYRVPRAHLCQMSSRQKNSSPANVPRPI